MTPGMHRTSENDDIQCKHSNVRCWVFPLTQGLLLISITKVLASWLTRVVRHFGPSAAKICPHWPHCHGIIHRQKFLKKMGYNSFELLLTRMRGKKLEHTPPHTLTCDADRHFKVAFRWRMEKGALQHERITICQHLSAIPSPEWLTLERHWLLTGRKTLSFTALYHPDTLTHTLTHTQTCALSKCHQLFYTQPFLLTRAFHSRSLSLFHSLPLKDSHSVT